MKTMTHNQKEKEMPEQCFLCGAEKGRKAARVGDTHGLIGKSCLSVIQDAKDVPWSNLLLEL